MSNDDYKIVSIMDKLEERVENELYEKLCEIGNEFVDSMVKVGAVGTVAVAFSDKNGNVFYRAWGETNKDAIYMIGILDMLKTVLAEGIDK